MKKQPGFEASFDARAARTCAAILFLELSLTVLLLVSFDWPCLCLMMRT